MGESGGEAIGESDAGSCGEEEGFVERGGLVGVGLASILLLLCKESRVGESDTVNADSSLVLESGRLESLLKFVEAVMAVIREVSTFWEGEEMSREA